jgi:hypothetical protein
MRKLLLVTIAAAVMVPLAWSGAAKRATPQVAHNWEEFWTLRGVAPPPPRDFLEGGFNGRILNLTDGRLSDHLAQQWALGDLRRGRGDLWATYQLRSDIVNADVFGPPGLNGSGQGIEFLRGKGVVHIDAADKFETIAIAVVSVSKAQQAKEPGSGLTDYVIVLLNRSTGKSGTFVHGDGHREEAPSGGAQGALSWQLDTGDFRPDPIIGPLWYQLRGWTCRPNDGSVAGEICGKLQPDAARGPVTTAARS